MSSQPDCIVVGAGTAGAAAAYFLARRGVSVVLVDRREEGHCGSRWVNTVETRVFDELEMTLADECVFIRPERYIMSTADGTARLTVHDPPIVELNTPAFVANLHEQAREAGVHIRYETSARIGAYRDGLKEVSLDGEVVKAPIVIEASGFSLAGLEPHMVPEFEVVSAHQGVYELRSERTARSWMNENRVEPGDTLSFVGLEGGYSFLNILVDPTQSAVSVLACAMHREAYRSGRQLAADFVSSNPWIGERRFGGAGLIPLRPTRESFVEDGLIRIGDAAGMTFPTHGNGLGAGLRAAQYAANTAAASLQRGITTTSELWEFNTLYFARRGVISAAYQPTRYMSMGFNTNELKALIEGGLITEKAVRKYLDISMLDLELPGPRPLLTRIASVIPIVPRFARCIELAIRFHRHYSRYPKRHEDFQAWEQKAADLYRAARKLAVTSGSDGSLPPEYL